MKGEGESPKFHVEREIVLGLGDGDTVLSLSGGEVLLGEVLPTKVQPEGTHGLWIDVEETPLLP
eukprot:JP436170.1.p3 GENE.JP436170.1~~JP436170.1.p3  ORF type:complete len:64 (+),score=13.41 JP436170.1:452-643(+)